MIFMFNLPELADWATEDAATFDALAAELDARWRADGLSWAALAAPTYDVVDTTDPAPWLLVERDNERPRRYPAVPLRELWGQLCPMSLTAWTREQAAELRATLDAPAPAATIDGELAEPVEATETPEAPEQWRDRLNVIRVVTGMGQASRDMFGAWRPGSPGRAAEPAQDVPVDAPEPVEAEAGPSRWRRVWRSHGLRTAGLTLGVAACVAAVVVAGVFYWSAWVSS